MGNSQEIENDQKTGNSQEIGKRQEMGNCQEIENDQKTGNSQEIRNSQEAGNSQEMGNSQERENGQETRNGQEIRDSQESAHGRIEWLDSSLAFIREAEGLKSVPRTAWTKTGRRESTAEHTWRLALLAGLCLAQYPQLDGQKVLMMSLIHDLGEIYDGDISAASGADGEEKHRSELAAMQRITSFLPQESAARILELWQDYNDAASPEARLVKALDKAETILQHNQGKNPPDFDYAFNLTYGKEYFADGGFLEELRQKLDEETARRVR